MLRQPKWPPTRAAEDACGKDLTEAKKAPAKRSANRKLTLHDQPFRSMLSAVGFGHEPATDGIQLSNAEPRTRKESAAMIPTKNDLPEKTRATVIELLGARLADAVDLQTQTKQAHWNVKGPSFIALHELFDKVNEDVEEYVDLFAERIVQLGGYADGSARSAAKRSTLAEYPHVLSGREHVEALSTALATFGKAVRANIDHADQAGDKDTADIFTEVSRGVDKWLWFVESHLHGDK
jgi:starvation-inducible DNA-binding protein